jgi:hypothetical protein
VVKVNDVPLTVETFTDVGGPLEIAPYPTDPVDAL